ncbi:MAG TPA: alkaline phosphatase family protein, partial [Gemmatimonadaceae bacterium]
NEDTVYEKEASWPTFPERLEEAGVSWRIYQNEVSIPTGLTAEEDAWLGSFGDNPLEWFTQYNIRFAKSRRAYLPTFLAQAPAEIAKREEALKSTTLTAAERRRVETELGHLRSELASAGPERAKYTDAAWAALSREAKALHERAFATNTGDPAHRSITKLSYSDDGTPREVNVPSGDILHQFRSDVASGALPAVSWVVAPQHFSDHPSSAWFGAWYVSEVLDILTKNPEVWKKTVFILCYDENDGYFDHVAPYVAPHPTRAETGKASRGIDTTVEWGNVHGRESAIGLGYRVPLVIASPWSRGGAVNSQVFDHTSIIQFIEQFAAARGKSVRETNISEWRRTVCGDLTSAFRPYADEAIAVPPPLGRDATVERIHAARFRPAPTPGVALSRDDIARVDVGAFQERGTRPSCPLPYELVVNAQRGDSTLDITLETRTRGFGGATQGAPFNLYSYGDAMTVRAYAVSAGDTIHDALPVNGKYHVRVDGPNGFTREFIGDATDPIAVTVNQIEKAGKLTNAMYVMMVNRLDKPCTVDLVDESYGAPARKFPLPDGSFTVRVDASEQKGWYDFSVRANNLTYRYAGRLETGEWSISDPVMGGVVSRRNS